MSAINFPLTTTSLFVNTLNTNKIIYLPAASTINAGRLFYIKDICGNAAKSSIYISTVGMDRIENYFRPSTLYAVMSTNYGSVLMAPDGALNWYFLQHYYKNAVSSLGATIVVSGTGGTATGGTITTNATYKIHTFTASGTFTLTSPAAITAQVLVVGGGGGGGGYYNGGGGGAGGAVYNSAFTITAGSYTVSIGNGGSGQSGYASAGTSGSSTTFSSLTGNGGGGGGSDNNVNGVSGGCGGGMGPLGATAPGSGTQGYAGGYGTNGPNMGTLGGTYGSGYGGGGGGGMGSVGSNALTSAGPGWGGTGATYSVGGTNYLVCGGGGAGTADTDNTNFGLGGSSIGGVGGLNSVRGAGNGTANTGSGGGGYGRNGAGSAGGTGGSGIVIIAYTNFTPTSIATLVQWLDATDNTTVLTAVSGSQVANGGSAGYWGDKSGSGNHVTTNTVAPTYSLSLINSKAGLNFQNSAGMISTAFAKSSNVTLCMVGTVKSTRGDWGTFWGHFTSGRHDADVQLRYTQSTSHINWHTNNNNGSSHLPYTIDSPVLYSCTMSGGTVMFMQQTNTTGTTSVTITESLTWAAGSAPVWIGRSDSGECINSYISEIAYFQSVLSTADRQKMEGYLAWKWGLNTYLPIGHPYLSAAP